MSVSKFQSDFDELSAGQAKNFDPVRFAYLQSLSMRLNASGHQKNATLVEKALSSLQQYRADLDNQRSRTRATIRKFSSAFPQHSDAVEALFQQCHFKQIEQLYIRLCGQDAAKQTLNPLRDLTSGINQVIGGINEPAAPPSIDDVLHQQEQSARLAKGEVLATTVDGSGEQLELQSMKYFRESMKHFNIDKIIARAIDEGPENPGPLNPQMLAIKSLTNMRDLSPEYLRRFAGYIETLLWLEKSTTKLNNNKNNL